MYLILEPEATADEGGAILTLGPSLTLSARGPGGIAVSGIGEQELHHLGSGSLCQDLGQLATLGLGGGDGGITLGAPIDTLWAEDETRVEGPRQGGEPAPPVADPE